MIPCAEPGAGPGRFRRIPVANPIWLRALGFGTDHEDAKLESADQIATIKSPAMSSSVRALRLSAGALSRPSAVTKREGVMYSFLIRDGQA